MSHCPIGFQQTLSQPYVVARMTELLLAAGPLGKVLEIGTGSGYQTAVLAQLVDQVYSVERIKPLLQKARQRTAAAETAQCPADHADGGMGWPERGPFDGIVVDRRAGAHPRGTAGPAGGPGRAAMVVPVGGEEPAPAGRDPHHRGAMRPTSSRRSISCPCAPGK